MLARVTILFLLIFVEYSGSCSSQAIHSADSIREVVVGKQPQYELQLEDEFRTLPDAQMSQPGLAIVTGGMKLRVETRNPGSVKLPVPQITDGQIPINFAIRSVPPEAVRQYQLEKRDERNTWISIELKDQRGQVEIRWASIVMLTDKYSVTKDTVIDDYRKATACVQSESEEIESLSQQLQKPSGSIVEFAGSIQKYIRDMKSVSPPRRLDALGIQASGFNGICTGNSNLAAALMRSEGVASRSLAVIPTNNKKLEMHRIVEVHENGKWISFDPSSVIAETPASRYQYVVMATTTIADEELSMWPRTGVSLGCPYGQEAELPMRGVYFNGPEFYWSIAKPFHVFEPTEEVVGAAADSWNYALKSGDLSQAKISSERPITNIDLLQLLKRTP